MSIEVKSTIPQNSSLQRKR